MGLILWGATVTWVVATVAVASGHLWGGPVLLASGITILVVSMLLGKDED